MIELNIGLNNNPYSFNQLSRLLNLMFFGAESRLDQSEWDGVVEPTLVCKITENWRIYELIDMIERLCTTLEQEAIAAKINGIGFLVYRPDYEGEKLSFDDTFFINF